MRGRTGGRFSAKSDSSSYDGLQSADDDPPLILFHEAEQKHAVHRLMRESVQDFLSVPPTNRTRDLCIMRHPEARKVITAQHLFLRHVAVTYDRDNCCSYVEIFSPIK